MLMSLDDAKKQIESGKWLHIAGNEDLLKALPKGNWIGGSTEYFMDLSGGVITNDQVFVDEIPYSTCKIFTYDENTISGITKDAYPNGFSVLILPSDSKVHVEYAKNAPQYENIFLKNIVGWVSGINLSSQNQTPIAVNGVTGEYFKNKAVAMHIELPADKIAAIQILNIFEQDDASPVIEFLEDSFSIRTCLVDGKEVVFSDYIAEKGIDTKLPLVGDYSGSGINVSFRKIENGAVDFYAPVFRGIQYRIAKEVPDYAKEFKTHVNQLPNVDPEFSCNCILNFLYGELEGKKLNSLYGPITFGEIAYQLVNQTYVYLFII